MNMFGKLFKKARRSVSTQTSDLIRHEWEQIDLLIGQKGPSQLRQALMKADKTLDNALRDLVSGETMGDRLKNAKDLFDYQTYDKIWKAHKMRNNLVHESGYEPPHHMVTRGTEVFRKALKSLGVNL